MNFFKYGDKKPTVNCNILLLLKHDLLTKCYSGQTQAACSHAKGPVGRKK